jgi:hypothetical protein
MNRERRKEGGKVFLDLSKYLATTVAIGSLLGKEKVDIFAVVAGTFMAIILYIVGYKIIPPDKEV